MNKLVLHQLLEKIPHSNFSVQYWDGDEKRYGDETPAFRLLFRNEPDFSDPDGSVSLYLGECFARGDMELEGDMDAAARAIETCEALFASGRKPAREFVARALQTVSLTQVKEKQKDQTSAHYDLGNEFFSLWLDSSMNYSCAYFMRSSDSLDKAQEQKIDLVLKKLCLSPGMRLLDIGCGWGSLALRAARRWQASVVGITLSEEQHAKARQRAAGEGLDHLVDIRLANYLDLDDTLPFDRIVSVGMFEHVGQEHIPGYFRKVSSLLAPGGVSLLHTLTKRTEGPINPWMQKHIFPGGYLPTLRELAAELDGQDFHVLHVESLRRHYAKTLKHWHARFSGPETLDKVRAMFGGEFTRMWSLYLRMAAAYLRNGSMDVHQLVFSKGVNNALPMTLAGIYQE